MPALRRSCDSCVIAKRRCDLATPHCSRCTLRSVRCTYINQPAVAEPTQLQPAMDRTIRQSQLFYTVNSSLSSARLVRERSPILGLQSPIPEVVRFFTPLTLQRQIHILRMFLVQFAQEGTACFLHPCLYESELPKPLQYASRICRGYAFGEGRYARLEAKNVEPQVSQMIRLAPIAGSFANLMAHVQAIAFLQIICLLEGQGFSGADQKAAEYDDRSFTELLLVLYIQAPASLPGMLSPWQAWLFAESVRRTILVCFIILAVRGGSRRGFAMHLLCFEALPFDMRSALWDAADVYSWDSAVAAASGQPSLVSLRQFVELVPSCSTPPFHHLLSLSFGQ